MARKMTKRPSKAQQLGLLTSGTALYIRVSTSKQAEEGFSLDAQQEKLAAFCVAQGWSVDPAHIYVDGGVSGKSTDRPSFQQMMQAAKDGRFQRIVAIKLDRLARNTKDFLAIVEQLQKYGCDLVLIKESFDTSTPHGKFALTMFAAIAELEASTITERVMTGKTQKATEGGYNGSYCPFGYTYSDGAFSIDNPQALTVRRIFAEFTAGNAMSKIAEGLNVDRIATAKGGQWYTSTVKYILQNGFYAGIAQWDDVETTARHEAIITPDVYEVAHRRLLAIRPGRVAA